MQHIALERRARLATDKLAPVRGPRWVSWRGHRPSDGDRRAGRRLEEYRSDRLTRDVRQSASRASADEAQLAAKETHYVEVVAQHFGHHEPFLVLHEGLPDEGGALAAGIRQKAGIDGCHAGKHDFPQVASVDPALELAIPGPETPILVHHQSDFVLDP